MKYRKKNNIKYDYIFCEVSFESGNGRYTYIADNENYKVGDLVFVPIGMDNREEIAEIKSIRYLPAYKAPYPVEKTKHIIRKVIDDEEPVSVPLAAINNTINSIQHIVDEMKHIISANWIQQTSLFGPDKFICSYCGDSYREQFRRCPTCGAYMKKTEYNPSWVDELESLSAMLDDDG